VEVKGEMRDTRRGLVWRVEETIRKESDRRRKISGEINQYKESTICLHNDILIIDLSQIVYG
jgi:hypothetical protein